MPRLIDTHAHLDADIYQRDLEIVVRHALQDDIWTVTVGNDYESSKRAVEIAEQFPAGVYAAVGLHPKHVPAELTADDKLLQLEKFAEIARHPKVVAIGECGLDYHDIPTSRHQTDRQRSERLKTNQKKVFGKFLDLSREFRLPLLLHCREAHEDMLGMLEVWDKTTRGFDSRGILHCFGGSWKEAKKYFNLDFMISVTGIVSHGHYQTEVIRKSPLSRLVLESDCPYLTTIPWSIRRNEPSYIESVASAVAGIRGEAAKDIARQTTANALGVLRRLPRS